MTLRRLRDMVCEMGEDETLLDLPVYAQKVTRDGVAIMGPGRVTEYGRSGSEIASVAYCDIPWHVRKEGL